MSSKSLRKFAYNELGQDQPVIVTEDDIRQTYWSYWKGEMEKRLAEGISRAPITWEYCLDDWIVCNWAWEVDATETK